MHWCATIVMQLVCYHCHWRASASNISLCPPLPCRQCATIVAWVHRVATLVHVALLRWSNRCSIRSSGQSPFTTTTIHNHQHHQSSSPSPHPLPTTIRHCCPCTSEGHSPSAFLFVPSTSPSPPPPPSISDGRKGRRRRRDSPTPPIFASYPNTKQSRC